MPPRRNSGFESEVRSPGGGSVRTGGPDLLNAILAHESDEEEDGEGQGKKREREVEGKEGGSGVDAGGEKSGEEKEEGKQVVDVGGGDEKKEGEGDDLETMEKIELPDRTKVSEVGDGGKTEGGVAGEQMEETESETKSQEVAA